MRAWQRKARPAFKGWLKAAVRDFGFEAKTWLRANPSATADGMRAFAYAAWDRHRYGKCALAPSLGKSLMIALLAITTTSNDMDGALDELALEGIELPAPMLEVLKRGGKVG